MWPDPDFVGTLIDGATGTVEHFLGRCDASNLSYLPERVLRLIAENGGGWVDIATNGAHVVYCWAQR